ncbi:MAG: hypothetical protein ACK56F_12970, partial [bacterium]
MPVVHVAWDVNDFAAGNPIREPLEWVGPRKGTAQKVAILRAHPIMALQMDEGEGGTVRSEFTSYRTPPPPPEASRKSTAICKVHNIRLLY